MPLGRSRWIAVALSDARTVVLPPNTPNSGSTEIAMYAANSGIPMIVESTSLPGRASALMLYGGYSSQSRNRYAYTRSCQRITPTANLNSPRGYLPVMRIANHERNVVKNQATCTKKNTNWLGIIAAQRMNSRKRDCRSASAMSNRSGYAPGSHENGGYSSRSSAT